MEKDTNEKWSQKYKKSIDCNNPKGFSQKAHCQGRKKKETKEDITVAPVSKEFVDNVMSKQETNETGADSSGSFVGPIGITKRQIYQKFDNNMKESIDFDGYDVPFGGGTKGRKDPLKIGGPNSIKKSRAVRDKNFPKWGGPGGVFIKIKEKCKKFPYCNQGDINAIETLSESITKLSKELNIPRNEIEKLVINEINKIFIEYENESSNRPN